MREDGLSSSVSEPSGSSEREREHEHANGGQQDAASPVNERRGPEENPYSDIREEDATDEAPGIMDKVVCFAGKELLYSA